MPIIQYILPSRNKALKKLLHTYWEVCPKYDENGKLKQEMILVVNAIRNDLVSLSLRSIFQDALTVFTATSK
jgi:coatomer subunit beta